MVEKIKQDLAVLYTVITKEMIEARRAGNTGYFHALESLQIDVARAVVTARMVFERVV